MNETNDAADTLQDGTAHHEQTETFAGGRIASRHGRVDLWLLIVYLVLFAWGLYYVYAYWGGLGPGLDLNL